METGGLQSMGSQRVGHDWATSLSLSFTHSISLLAQQWESACSVWATVDMASIPGLGRSPGERHGNPLQYSRLENSPGTEEPGRLKFIGSQRVRNDWSDLTDRHSINSVYMSIPISQFIPPPFPLWCKEFFLNQSKEQNSSLASFFLSTYIVKIYTQQTIRKDLSKAFVGLHYFLKRISLRSKQKNSVFLLQKKLRQN